MRNNKAEVFDVDQKYTTKLYTKEALQFININKNKPFFLYLAHNMPHVPIYASEDFIGSSNRGLYGDVIQEIDWSVGQILDELEDLQLLENTLIIFSSDNGPWLVMEDYGGSAGGLREGKMFTFEGGMRVPTVAMWKGKIPKNIVSEDVASQMDWFPTFAKLVGIDLPKDRTIDGHDISEVLFNTGKRKDSTYLFFDGDDLQCYRSGNWKIKLPYKGFEGTRWKQAVDAHDTLLFNIRIDTEEKINLYASSPEMFKKLYKEMNLKYRNLGELPPSLIVRSDADESHFQHLINK
jgi:arylsulfatase A-like enzyme